MTLTRAEGKTGLLALIDIAEENPRLRALMMENMVHIIEVSKRRREEKANHEKARAWTRDQEG